MLVIQQVPTRGGGSHHLLGPPIHSASAMKQSEAWYLKSHCPTRFLPA